LLTETVTSPTLHGQLQKLLTEFPAAKWHQYEPVNRDSVRQGAQLAFGTSVSTRYDFDKANVVVSLDADFLSVGPGRLRYTRDFTARRKVRGNQHEMNRLYVVESTPSNTGAMADHRLPLRAVTAESQD
jgi:molybdopterin-containing oxidoreductase family iron-sulfur binding subunit